MLKVAICDDEEHILEELSNQIMCAFQNHKCPVSINRFTNCSELLLRYPSHPYDVLFLDIDMPETDGILAGQRLRKEEAQCCIIYVSNREERVFETFSVSPLRFIRKSRFSQEIEEAVSAVLRWKKQLLPQSIVFSSRGKIISLSPHKIIYIECWAKVQNIITTSDVHEVRSTLKTMEENLTPFGFLKPHKGYLVNFRFIESIECGNIILSTGQAVPVSKYRLQETKQEYLRLVTSELTYRGVRNSRQKGAPDEI